MSGFKNLTMKGTYDVEMPSDTEVTLLSSVQGNIAVYPYKTPDEPFGIQVNIESKEYDFDEGDIKWVGATLNLTRAKAIKLRDYLVEQLELDG